MFSTRFWKQKVCWHHPAMFCHITSSKFSRQQFEFSLKWRWWDRIQAIFLNLFYFNFFLWKWTCFKIGDWIQFQNVHNVVCWKKGKKKENETKKKNTSFCLSNWPLFVTWALRMETILKMILDFISFFRESELVL